MFRYFFVNFILFSFLFNSALIMPQKKEIVAYYPEFRSRNQNYYLKDLERIGSASKITIINYAFVEPGLDSSGKIIPQFMSAYSAYQENYPAELSIDGIADDSVQALRGQFNQLKKLKKRNPHIKLLLAIGGWAGSKYFSDLALTPEAREIFVDASIDMFIKGNLPLENNAGGKGSAEGLFDGFDLDWEFPVNGGMEGNHYNVNDTQNHTALLALFRKKLDEINPDLLLTAAISARASDFWKYDFKEDQKYLDWYNVMTYDFHGSWENKTGHHTNLLSSPFDPDTEKNSLDYTIKFLLDSVGVNSRKIVPGAAFYGKGWRNVNPVNFGLYQSGISDSLVQNKRFKNYSDFSNLHEEGYQLYWDNFAMAGWLYNQEDSVFWTYDELRSIALKARYVDAYNLRGLMFWEITGDDTLGTLVNTIYHRNMPDIINYNEKENIQPTSPIKSELLPAVEIIEPKSNEYFNEGSNIIIKTFPFVKENLIIKVEFFIDGNSIGYNNIAPFSWVWFNAAPGKHEIKVEATDHTGKKTISKEIVVNIQLKE